jgi:hypothetical protein
MVRNTSNWNVHDPDIERDGFGSFQPELYGAHDAQVVE